MIKPVLENLKVLICRPEPSANELSAVLQSVGAKTEVLPCLAINPLELSAEDKQKILDLDQYDHVIVVSQHAARIACDDIDQYWPQMPVKQSWYAIGRKTAEALRPLDIQQIEPKADLSSEALLDLPPLQDLRSKNILILKGAGGRNLLENSLRNRGAKVDTLSLYERVCPRYESELVQSKIQTFDPDYIVTLSAETVLNLIKLSRDANIKIEQNKLIVSSQRVAEVASKQGFKLTYVADNLLPIDIIRCIAKAKNKQQ